MSDAFKKILITTDLSETSEKAFEPARLLARKFGAQLILVYIEEDRLPPLVIEYTAVSMEDLAARQHERATESLEEIKRTQFSDFQVDSRVSHGTPHVEIVRIAEEVGADLIVMATHGRGFISHAFLGSTAERVLRRAPCPVLVTRDTGA